MRLFCNAMQHQQLQAFLDQKVEQYNKPTFIPQDPICIPHLFTQQADIEIAGLFAALFAWGNRTIIINKSKELLHRMDMAPFDFVCNHQPNDLKKLLGFKHRTFTDGDVLYFIEFLQQHYKKHPSLEAAFTMGHNKRDENIANALNSFYTYFFSYEHLPRTHKHIAAPYKKSTCKRLNMYLRWMVRSDNNGVDFGLWKTIKPAQLICPIDVHVARVATRFNLLTRPQIDWAAAEELTKYLKKLDPTDPVKYDFALFGLGVMEPKFIKFELV
jgi:uncharacterized protein (TIGR02757 family)